MARKKKAEIRALMPAEQKSLASYEAKIEQCVGEFTETCKAFAAIKASNLWRCTTRHNKATEEDYYVRSWEEYLDIRWGFSKGWVSKLIGSAEVLEALESPPPLEKSRTTPCHAILPKGGANVLPTKQAQFQPLLSLGKKPGPGEPREIDAEAAQTVWRRSCQQAPKDEDGIPQPTGKIVATEVKLWKQEHPPQEEVQDTEPAVDLDGVPLPEPAANYTGYVDTFKRWCRELRRVKAEVKADATQPAMAYANAPALMTAVEKAATIAAKAAAGYLCPWCLGEGEAEDEDGNMQPCPHCRNLGLVTKAMQDGEPATERQKVILLKRGLYVEVTKAEASRQLDAIAVQENWAKRG